MNPIDLVKHSNIEPHELRRIAAGAILTALPPAIFQLQSAASVILSCPTDYYSPASAAWFLTGAAWAPCGPGHPAPSPPASPARYRSRALDLGIAAVLFALTVRSAIRLDPYSIGYLATAFTCFAVSGLKEE